MSFDIHWDALDDAAAAAAQRFLNERFQHLPSRPAFLGDVTIQQLSFGSVPPSLELVDITEPYADFYLAGPNGPVKRGEMDLQATLRFEYKGDFTLQVATELQVNYPTEHFAALPVTVTVTEIACSGTALLVNIGEEVYVSILEDDQAGSPFHMDIKLESQVGDASKQVIRNLSRVLERFIAEQLQRIVREQLAFPNHVGLPKRALSTT